MHGNIFFFRLKLRRKTNACWCVCVGVRKVGSGRRSIKEKKERDFIEIAR